MCSLKVAAGTPCARKRGGGGGTDYGVDRAPQSDTKETQQAAKSWGGTWGWQSALGGRPGRRRRGAAEAQVGPRPRPRVAEWSSGCCCRTLAEGV